MSLAQACVQGQQREEERDNVGRERELEVRVGQLHQARAATWRHGYTRERRSEEARATESARRSSFFARVFERVFDREFESWESSTGPLSCARLTRSGPF